MKYLTTFRTKRGQWVRVREMLPADVNHLVHLYRHLSPESLYARFQEPATDLHPMRVLEEARQLAESGYRQGKGLLAFVDLPGQPGVPIAGARFVRVAPGVAEISITVRDDYQGQGVGSHLVGLLIQEARKQGIHTIIAHVQAYNRAAMSLIHRYGLPYTRQHYGPEVYLEIDISSVPINGTIPPFETAREPVRVPPARPARIADIASSG